MAEITDLLDRTTPRQVRPPDVADLVRRGRRRRQRRRATLLVPPVLVVGTLAALALGPSAPRDAQDDRATVIDEDETEPLLIAVPPDVDVVVFLERRVQPDELDAIHTLIDEDPRLVSLEYYDTEQSLAEFRRIFANNEAMLERIEENPDLLPASFRIVVGAPEDPDAIRALADQLGAQPGVLKVTTPNLPHR